ncbi:TetR/AcrR family transcriptional regulator [Amphibacillus indicireducens]|uniref:HTH tetR-type domain-containing protein n=1 Tax=Amphibacillus indicireducens TaxID=1076330 RepID=A0ABP7VVI8_9BACI
MKKRVDPRIARTTKMIMKSLRKLGRERGLDAITIKEITEAAQVNRTTFYYHYRDKNDVIEKTLLEDFEIYLLSPIMACEKINEETLRIIYFAFINLHYS